MKHRFVSLLFVAVLFVSAYSLASAAVDYVGADTETQGDWIGTYGNNGAIVFGLADMEDLKNITAFDDGGNQRWDWENPTEDARGALYPDGSGQRTGSCIFNNPESILTVETSLSEYQVAVLALDWDSADRIMGLTGYQGDAPADPDVIVENPEFNAGMYHIWHVTGGDPFRLRITHEGGANWVLTGLFVDDMNSAAVEPGAKLTTTWGQLKK